MSIDGRAKQKKWEDIAPTPARVPKPGEILLLRISTKDFGVDRPFLVVAQPLSNRDTPLVNGELFLDPVLDTKAEFVRDRMFQTLDVTTRHFYVPMVKQGWEVGQWHYQDEEEPVGFSHLERPRVKGEGK